MSYLSHSAAYNNDDGIPTPANLVHNLSMGPVHNVGAVDQKQPVARLQPCLGCWTSRVNMPNALPVAALFPRTGKEKTKVKRNLRSALQKWLKSGKMV